MLVGGMKRAPAPPVSGVAWSMIDKPTTIWRPLSEYHRTSEQTVILGRLENGVLWEAVRGSWREGETHEEWDEVEDGVQIKIDEWQEDGQWISDYDCELDFEPTHWASISGGESLQ